MSYTPHMTSQEWAYMSDETATSAGDSGTFARFIFQGTCEDYGCQGPSTEGSCFELAEQLNIPAVSSISATDSDFSSPGWVSCLLDCDGGVKFMSGSGYYHYSSSGYWDKPGICSCPRGFSISSAPLPRVTVLVSWLSDGTDVDLWLKLESGEDLGGSWYNILTDVDEGLGPEMLRFDDIGSHELGVTYSTNSGGNARGVLTIWSNTSSVPTILPFIVPLNTWDIITVARLDVRADHVAVQSPYV